MKEEPGGGAKKVKGCSAGGINGGRHVCPGGGRRGRHSLDGSNRTCIRLLLRCLVLLVPEKVALDGENGLVQFLICLLQGFVIQRGPACLDAAIHYNNTINNPIRLHSR